MTLQTKILGESTPTGRYNPDLAEKMAKQVEAEEQKSALEAKTQPQESEKPVEQVTNPINPNRSKNEYVFVPSLGLYISKNTYLQRHSWNETQAKLQKMRIRMPTIPEFIEFIKYLKSPEGKANVTDAKDIVDNIVIPKRLYRGEWLDAKFQKSFINGMQVNYHSFDSNGNIIEKQEKLENYSENDKVHSMYLDFWLELHTKQGLPAGNSIWSNARYQPPKNGQVASFYMDSIRSYLDCNKDPDSTHPLTGTRYVVINPNEN